MNISLCYIAERLPNHPRKCWYCLPTENCHFGCLYWHNECLIYYIWDPDVVTLVCIKLKNVWRKHCKLTIQKLYSLGYTSLICYHVVLWHQNKTFLWWIIQQDKFVSFPAFAWKVRIVSLPMNNSRLFNESCREVFWTHWRGHTADSQLKEPVSSSSVASCMYTALRIPQVSQVFCNCRYMCSWMQNREIRTFKMLQKSFLWLIKAWNWVSSTAAGRIRLLGTVNSYTHKITPHTELPNPLVPHCHTQLSDCPVELGCGCFHPTVCAQRSDYEIRIHHCTVCCKGQNNLF